MSDSVFPHKGVFHPAHGALDPRSGSYGEDSLGLSKRELFAAMAMQGMYANPRALELIEAAGMTAPQAFAPSAVKIADALIAELAKAAP